MWPATAARPTATPTSRTRTSSIQEFGFNPITGKIYDPAATHDLMSYCPAGGSRQGWISPFTWNKMFSGLATTALNAAASSPEQPNVGLLYETSAAQSLMVNRHHLQPRDAAGKGRGAGRPGARRRWVGLRDPAGEYAVQLRQGSTILAQRTFTVTFRSEYAGHDGTHPEGSDEQPPFPPEPSPQADVSFIMPWAAGADTVALVRDGQVLDQRRVSANPPTVQITSPAGGRDLAGRLDADGVLARQRRRWRHADLFAALQPRRRRQLGVPGRSSDCARLTRSR